MAKLKIDVIESKKLFNFAQKGLSSFTVSMVITKKHVPLALRSEMKKKFREEIMKLPCPHCKNKLFIYIYTK